MLATARNLGMVLGIGIAGAIFTTVLGQSTDGQTVEALVHAVEDALLAAAGLAVLGAITSAVPR